MAGGIDNVIPEHTTRQESAASTHSVIPDEFSPLTRNEMFSVIWQYASLLNDDALRDMFALVCDLADSRRSCGCKTDTGDAQLTECTLGCRPMLTNLVNRKLNAAPSALTNSVNAFATTMTNRQRTISQQSQHSAGIVIEENSPVLLPAQVGGLYGLNDLNNALELGSESSDGVNSDVNTAKVTTAWTRVGDGREAFDEIEDEPSDAPRASTNMDLMTPQASAKSVLYSSKDTASFKLDGMAYLLEQHNTKFLDAARTRRTAEGSPDLSATGISKDSWDEAAKLYEQCMPLIVEEKFSMAEALLLQAIKAAPEHAESLYTLGWIKEQEQGQNSMEAEIYYNRAIGADPTYADALCRYALLLSRRDDDQDAQIYLERAIESNPDHESSLVHLGLLADDQGKCEHALSYFDKVLPRLIEKQDKSLTVEIVRRYAGLLEEADRSEDADRMFTAGMAMSGNDYNILIQYALHMYKKGDTTKATELLDQAAVIATTGDPHVLYALMLEDQGHLAGAIAQFEKAAKKGMTADAKVYYAGLLAQTGDVDLACKFYVEVLRDDKVTDPAIMANYATLLANTGNLNEALNLYGKILYDREIQNEDEAIICDIMSSYLRYLEECERDEEACAVIEHVCERMPACIKARLKRADYAQRHGDLTLASQYLNELMQNNPFDADVHIAMAQLYSFNDQKRYAESIFRDALRKVDEKHKVAAAYGRWLHGLGFFKLAEPLYLQCLKDRPDDIDTLFSYVMLLKEQGTFKGLEERQLLELEAQHEREDNPNGLVSPRDPGQMIPKPPARAFEPPRKQPIIVNPASAGRSSTRETLAAMQKSNERASKSVSPTQQSRDPANPVPIRLSTKPARSHGAATSSGARPSKALPSFVVEAPPEKNRFGSANTHYVLDILEKARSSSNQ